MSELHPSAQEIYDAVKARMMERVTPKHEPIVFFNTEEDADAFIETLAAMDDRVI